LRLTRLLDALPNVVIRDSTDLNISDLTYDSRRVAPGSLFVSVPSLGSGSESRAYIEQAIAQGAVAIATQEHSDVRGATVLRIPDSRRALASLADEWFDHPSRELQVYAVTGTDGKTTTTYLLEQILAAAGLSTGLIGTVQTKIGDARHRNLDRMTTPESLDVQRLLREMVDAGITHVAMEASSHALALDRLRGVCFAACALTNITADHVEFHGSWEKYFEAKASLFSNLAPDVPAVLNRDDAHFDQLAGMLRQPVMTYGLDNRAQLFAEQVLESREGTDALLHSPQQTIQIHVPLSGRFNVYNALAATALAMTADIDLADIAAALGAASPPPGRLQRVNAGQPFDVVLDYAHTTHAFESVLCSARKWTPEGNRVIAVFGATGNRDRAKRPVLGKLAHRYTDFFVITNEDPYNENPQEIIDEVAAGVPSAAEGYQFVRELHRDAAIRLAFNWALPGDTVLVLGKGHEQSMVVDGRKEAWSDLAVVERLLGAQT